MGGRKEVSVWSPDPRSLQALECALSNIKSKMSPGRVGVVRLSGLVTCDDRAVFKEMASQLCRSSSQPLLSAQLELCYLLCVLLLILPLRPL